MSPSSKGWRDPEEPRTSEPRSVGDIVRGLLGHRAFSRGIPLGTLARSWVDVVGERLAAETRPARLDGGTLVVQATSGPWGSQARFLAEEIRARANSMLRSEEVKRVQVVVDPAGSQRSKPL